MDIYIEGVKGSGKTYYAVDYISKLSDTSKVLSNIKWRSLEEGGKGVLGRSISELAKDWGLKPIDFFRDSLHDEDSPKHDQRFLQLRGFTFVIDECQKLFPKGFKDQDVLQFFQMSRHYNIECVLLTQDTTLVCREVALHAEFVIRALSATVNPVPGHFVYRKLVGWETVGAPITLRKKKDVFALYKSTDTGEHTKQKKPFVMFLAVMIVAGVGALISFMWQAKDMQQSAAKNKDQAVSNQDEINQKIEKNFSKQSQTEEKDYTTKNYSPSFADQVGGVLMPISTTSLDGKLYVIYMEHLLPLELFPYRVIKTKLGTFSIVPPDVYEVAYVKRKIDSQKYLDYDPNAKYIVHTNQQKQISDNSFERRAEQPINQSEAKKWN